MSLQHDLFIQKFKQVEQAIRMSDETPADANFKWLEDKMGKSPLQSRMAICRYARNYIQHEPDYENMIQISRGMIETLDYIYNTIVKQTYFDIMKPMSLYSLSETSSIKQLLSMLSSFKIVIIYDNYNRLVTTLCADNIIKYIALYGLNGSISDILKYTDTFYDCKFVSKNDRAVKNEKITIVTENGSISEPILGIVI